MCLLKSKEATRESQNRRIADVKTPNEIFARHLLATRRQQSGESLDEFLLELRKLRKDCNLKAVSAEQYKEELVRDSFISGLSSPLIRQRLLENKTLTLDQAYSQATSLDVAQKNSAAYSHPAVHVAAVDLPSTAEDDNSLCPDLLGQKPPLANNPPLATTYSKNKCFYCGVLHITDVNVPPVKQCVIRVGLRVTSVVCV